MGSLLWINEKNDEAVELGSPLLLWKSLAELGRLEPEAFPTIHSLPDRLEQSVSKKDLDVMKNEATEALKRYGEKLSDHTKWILRQLINWRSALDSGEEE